MKALCQYTLNVIPKQTPGKGQARTLAQPTEFLVNLVDYDHNPAPELLLFPFSQFSIRRDAMPFAAASTPSRP